ncbi:MAG: ATP-binding protein [Planctomycetes bacterium]|nr:ATP-binding protein [Planctomycetota bacterium]
MEKFKFTVDSALLSELGEKLVEFPHIALVELVKNAYDADATRVDIKFIEQKTGAPEIHIIDNGHGMTLDDVKNYWMRIATTNKIKNNYSPLYGRPKTGEKGIGRFACRRLGLHLKLITIAKSTGNNYERTEVEFLWDHFKAGKEVTEIECPGKNEKIKDAQTGTTLIISKGQKNEWQKRGYDFAKRQFCLLAINRGEKRKGFAEDPGFNIFMTFPQMEGTTEAIDMRQQVISGGWGVLKGHVDSKGNATYTLDALDIGERTFKSSEEYTNLKDVTMEIGIIPGSRKDQYKDPKLLKEEYKNSNLLKDWVVKNFLDDWGGVQVRFKGFRVYPYGDDDWLDIDRDRALSKGASESKELEKVVYTFNNVVLPSRYLLSLLSMRSYVGSVNIGEGATGFEMKASREKFVDSKATEELKNFVRYGIDWATILRDYYKRLKETSSSEKAAEKLGEVIGKKVGPEKVVEAATAYLKQQVDSISNLLPKNKREELEKSIPAITNSILKYDKLKTGELHHLRLVASTSTLLNIFAHDVKLFTGSLSSSRVKLKDLEDRVSAKDKEFIKEIRNGLNDSKKRFNDLLEMTALIGTENISTPPQQLALFDRIESAERCFKPILDEYHIKINYDQVPKNLLVGPMLEGELYAILLNTLSNSIKAVIAEGQNKIIEIAATMVEKKAKLNIRDSGIGLDENHFDDVFIPFIADPTNKLYKELEKKINPRDKYIVGMGSGLGLSIVKDIVKLRKGEIRFVKPTGNWKTDLEVILP